MTPMLLSLFTATLLAADAPKAGAKTDAEKIKGVWTVLAAESDGKSLKDVLQATLTVDTTELYLTLTTGKTNRATYTLDPSKTPKQIDWKMSQNGKPDTMQAIYELDGEQLTLCIAERGDRPKEFKAPDRNTILLKLKFTRALPDPNDPALKAELEKLKGKWEVVAAADDGKPAPPEKLKDGHFAIDGNKLTMVGPGQKVEATFTLVLTENPRHFDSRRIDGERIETSFGIYELDGDSLTLCLGFQGAARPKELKSQRNVVFFKLRRAKP